MPAKTTMEKLLDLSAKFVIAQKGCWEHADWEGFLGKASALGVEINDESKRTLGNILESCKSLYAMGSAPAPAKKKAAAKPKAKAKAKAKAK